MTCAAPWRASLPIAATAPRCAWRRPQDCPQEIIDFLLQQFALEPRGPVCGARAGEPEPPLGAVRPGAAPGPEVPAFHARRCPATDRSTGPVRGDPPQRPAAAPSVPELRAGAWTSCARRPQTRRCWRSNRPCTAPAAIRPIVDALVAAAHAGKDVTVIVELRARFDEEANIELSNRLQEAGAHVMYGVVGLQDPRQAHAWSCGARADGIRRYCHLGTGNYHPRPRAPTPTTGCSPATRRSVPTCTRSSCSSPA